MAHTGGTPVPLPPFEPCGVYAAAKPKVPFSGKAAPEARTTLVTSYFALGSSKHSLGEYAEWMATMVCIESPMVVFVDAASADHIRQLRNGCLDGAELDVRVTSFEELYTAKWREVLEAQVSSDPEAKIGHSADLYMIWDEKSAWLDDVAKDNPFGTKYFAWVDIGYFRGRKYHTPARAFRGVPWPGPERTKEFEDGRVHVLGLAPVIPGSAECSDVDAIFESFGKRGVGGGFIAGTAEAIAEWRTAFYNQMQVFIDDNRFVGKDQIIMAAVACWRPDLVRVVPACGGDWFYMATFLRDTVWPM